MSVDRVVRRAQLLAMTNGAHAVTRTHLLVAVMAAADTRWPTVIVRRDGLSYAAALKRLKWKDNERGDGAPSVRYPPSTRLMLVIVFTSGWRLSVRFLRRYTRVIKPPSLDRGARDVIAVSQSLRPANQPDDGDVGMLLLVLTSSPGAHLSLVDNANVLAAAVRCELGFASWNHRLLVRLDSPKLLTRGLRGRLAQGVARRGWISVYGVGLLVFRLVGISIVCALFILTVPPTLSMYLFLWPAFLLMSAIRVVVSRLTGLETRTHKWYEIPGGESALAGDGNSVDARRVARTLLLPRLMAFALCVITFVFVGWRSDRLGIALFPTIFARPDLLLGLDPNASVLTPFTLFADTLIQNGWSNGIGLLAGLGLGVLSLPTYREISLIRLHAQHELGSGTFLGRAATLPAALLTGLFASIEAVLPLRNGPLYLTVYVLPLFASVGLAAAIDRLMPY